MQLPILSGIYTDAQANLRTAYPINRVPVPKQSGVSAGFLRPADGIVPFATGPAIDRGGIEWNGVCYRVMGTAFVRVNADGTIDRLGGVLDVDGGRVSMDYSFDLLCIVSGGRAYYWDGASLTTITDSDLGFVIDVVWVDGYFMFTDGEFLIVTELNDPYSINPLKYGSSEADPDPVTALLKIRNEVVAVNRDTCEVFDNIGGQFFPFQRTEGAQLMKGCFSTHGCCVYLDQLAFIGSGRNEAPGVYLGESGSVQKISTQEVDEVLLTFTDEQLRTVVLEARNDRSHQFLYVHLPDRTLVYDAAGSAATEVPVWFCLTSSYEGFQQYRAIGFVWCYNKWLFGDTQTPQIGYFTQDIGTHWGDHVRWQINTVITYNDGAGAVFNRLELVSLPGRIENGINPIISTQYSLDGVTWSQPKDIRAGKIGDRTARLVWWRQGNMRNIRIQRFYGFSDAHVSFARLEADLEPLAW